MPAVFYVVLSKNLRGHLQIAKYITLPGAFCIDTRVGTPGSITPHLRLHAIRKFLRMAQAKL